MKPRVALSATAVLLTAALAGGVAWADAQQYTQRECEADERDHWPRLESAARTVMGDMGDRYARVSLCEDAGPPGHTSLRVSVYEWRRRSEARAFLHDAGMVARDGHWVAETPSGVVSIGYPKVTDYLENDGRVFVQVWFGLEE